MASYELEYDELDELQKAMEDYGEGSRRIINDVLHGEGGLKIKDQIHMLIPSSGRSWRGKRAPAASADSLQQVNTEMMAVTIRSKTAYNYLYFPDDGSNTRKHAGNQQFFMRGAENASESVVELCLGKLTEQFQ